MMIRIKDIFIFSTLIYSVCNAQQEASQKINDGADKRKYLITGMLKIADPVLNALSKNELKQKMPVEAKTADRQNYTYLEAFGRLLSGMSSWLELGADNTDEGKLRGKYIQLARVCLHNTTNPSSPDFMNFNNAASTIALNKSQLFCPGLITLEDFNALIIFCFVC